MPSPAYDINVLQTTTEYKYNQVVAFCLAGIRPAHSSSQLHSQEEHCIELLITHPTGE